MQLQGGPQVRTLRRDRQGKHLLLACADKTLRLLKLCPVPPSGKGLELAALKAQLATPAAQVSERNDGWHPTSNGLTCLKPDT